MPEAKRGTPARRAAPGQLAERLAEVRVGDEELALVYRSTPAVQRHRHRLDGVRLLPVVVVVGPQPSRASCGSGALAGSV